jgi:hypothetical protein
MILGLWELTLKGARGQAPVRVGGGCWTARSIDEGGECMVSGRLRQVLRLQED